MWGLKKTLWSSGLLLLVASLPAHAAPCGPADAAPGAAPPKAWQVWQAGEAEMVVGEHLLGRQGQRVKVGSLSEPQVIMEGRRMRLAPLWPEQVDWPAYQPDEARLQPGSLLYFEQDAAGAARLCRVDELGLSAAFEERRADAPGPLVPTADDLQLVATQTFRYDSEGRLLGVMQWRREAARQAPWQLQAAHCFAYDPLGGLAALWQPSEGACALAVPADARARHVYDAQGQLLRSITVEPRMEELDGRYELVEHPVVTVHGSQGEVRAVYTEDAARRPYRRPLASGEASDALREVWVIGSAAGLNLRWIDEGLPAAGRDWRMVAISADSPQPVLAALGNEGTVLARGRTGKQGEIRTGKAAAAVWRAMQQPGQWVVLVSMSTILLTPELPGSLWQACLDPEQRTAAACP